MKTLGAIALVVFSLSLVGCSGSAGSAHSEAPTRDEYYGVAERLFEEYGLAEYGLSFSLMIDQVPLDEKYEDIYRLPLDEFEELVRKDMQEIVDEQESFREKAESSKPTD